MSGREFTAVFAAMDKAAIGAMSALTTVANPKRALAHLAIQALQTQKDYADST